MAPSSRGRRKSRRAFPISAAAPTSIRRPTIRRSQLFFVMARETCAIYTPIKQEMVPGRVFMSGGMRKLPEPDYGALRALDSEDRRDQVGVQASDAVACRRDVNGVRTRLRGRQRGELQRVRLAHAASGSGRIEWARSSGVRRRRPSCSTGVSYVLMPSGNTLVAFGLHGTLDQLPMANSRFPMLNSQRPCCADSAHREFGCSLWRH